MYIEKDNFLIKAENNVFGLVFLSSMGDRADQQDSAGYLLDDDSGTVIICDGMGGHKGGKLASRIGVESFLKRMPNINRDCINYELLDLVEDIDEEIASLKDEDGNPLRAGSTLAAVYIQKNNLFWVSVGDSRIYILRKDEFIQVTEDHTYELALKENVKAGEITEQFYQEEIDKSEALISFLGAGELPIISSNDNAFKLQSGDQILLMSDGLYKNISDEYIMSILTNFKNPSESLTSLDLQSSRNAHKHDKRRDNLTVALINIK